MTNHYRDRETNTIAKMYKKFGLDTSTTPNLMTPDLCLEREEKMREELDEFSAAWMSGDLAKAADALIDLVVFAKGTAVMMGLPWRELFQEVNRANMSKERGVAPNRPNHSQDLIKPEGWIAPRIDQILSNYLED